MLNPQPRRNGEKPHHAIARTKTRHPSIHHQPRVQTPPSPPSGNQSIDTPLPVKRIGLNPPLPFNPFPHRSPTLAGPRSKPHTFCALKRAKTRQNHHNDKDGGEGGEEGKTQGVGCCSRAR
ncbi:hypothetical protein BU24DRAFT_166098 [Aaosphaeria arxii CBS 175.79]|uniref:Uncharacterized protein n=1 Tax=Aaosphaeria arxii CBS 175.79 TaxID=1450172 RepID=A0A6A5XZ34_9PLEO|nr:uncharacterized protein BU24DRAFT_166098 [Aaosphaeria arxii CBS 175.79]KAF2018153.1 hypothetical protein BU24DRAFT_166098 [Aaosphaeria arxii CBS 175.79]